jgi:D-glycero-D-manno-heptose 1,7-bisphosphate phosphatase
VNRAAFLDRDGVINQLVVDPTSGLPESPLEVDQVALIPGAPEALARISAAGYLLVGASNQPAAAKGTVPLEQLEAVHARVLELLALKGVRFEQFRVCWHHPDGTVAGLAGPCRCRKPAPGMLLDAMRELDIDPAHSWMIGDSDNDVLAARAAGLRSVLIDYPPSAHRRAGAAAADATVRDIDGAASFVVGRWSYDVPDG